MANEEKTEIAELKARVAELERALRPPPPFKSDYVAPINPIDRMSMPASVVREMAAAVPDHLVRTIARDRYSTAPVSQVSQPEPTSKPVNTTGFRDALPLAPPPGVALADRLMDVQDAKDRADLIVGEAGRRVRR
jgi:hypothetical protein